MDPTDPDSDSDPDTQHCLEVVDLAPLLLHPVLQVVHLSLLHLAASIYQFIFKMAIFISIKATRTSFFQLFQSNTENFYANQTIVTSYI
jgi:hypothetical protein